MSEIDNRRLLEILDVAKDRKEQAVADGDFEEAALWRDAKFMASEILVKRTELGDGSVRRDQIRKIAEFEHVATYCTSAWLARKLLAYMDNDKSQDAPPWDAKQIQESLAKDQPHEAHPTHPQDSDEADGNQAEAAEGG